jgi:hypothetical protein
LRWNVHSHIGFDYRLAGQGIAFIHIFGSKTKRTAPPDVAIVYFDHTAAAPPLTAAWLAYFYRGQSSGFGKQRSGLNNYRLRDYVESDCMFSHR